MAAPTLCPAGAWRLATICRPWAIRTVADRRRAVGMLPRAGFEALRVKSGLSPLRNIHRVRIGCAKGAANALGRQHPIRSIAGCRLQRSDVDQSRLPVGGVAISLLIASPMLRDHVNGMRGFSALRCWLGRRFRDRLGPNVSAALAMVGPALRAGPHHARVQRPKCIVPLTAAAASGRPAWWVARPSKGFDNGKLSADLIFAWRPADAPHATRPRPAC